MPLRREWTRTSASQHRAFNQCQRYWFFGWIERVPKVTSLAMQRGTDIHIETEHFLRTGEIRDSSYTDQNLNYRPYVEVIRPYLPEPGHPELIIEYPIELSCGPGMPTWIGFIDIGFSALVPLILRDIKTTSDFRYAKTPVELFEDIQLMSYAKWVYVETDYEGPIDVGHIYVKTEKRCVRKKPKTKLVQAVVDQGHVEDLWEREMETVAIMMKAAKAPTAQDLPPTTSACSMYGGCPYLSRCGLGKATTGLLKGLTGKDKGKEIMNEFMKKLRKKSKETDGKGKTDDKSFMAKLKLGVLPPDAPSRITETKESEPEPEPKVEKSKVSSSKKASSPKGKKASSPKGKKASSPKGKKGLVLYIDCMPVKSTSDVEPTLFEDWFNPLVMKMNEFVQNESGLPSYRLLSFSEEKAMIDAAVIEAIPSMPNVMIVCSGTPGAKDALGTLVPHATEVIRAIR